MRKLTVRTIERKLKFEECVGAKITDSEVMELRNKGYYVRSTNGGFYIGKTYEAVYC